MSGSQQHPYHLVEPSPWPAVGAASGFVVTIGAAMYMHDKPYGLETLAVGLGLGNSNHVLMVARYRKRS